MPKKGMAPLRRSQVINAVFGHVAENGLENLTLDRIAARAGVSKGVISYYFKNKRTLLLESFKAFLEGYNEEIMKSFRPGMSALDLLFLIIGATLRPKAAPISPREPPRPKSGNEPPNQDRTPRLEEYPKVFFHFVQKSILDREFRKIVIEMYGMFLRSTVQAIEYGIERSEFRQVDARAASYGLFALMDGILLHRAMGFKPMDLESVEKICRDYIGALRN